MAITREADPFNLDRPAVRHSGSLHSSGSPFASLKLATMEAYIESVKENFAMLYVDRLHPKRRHWVRFLSIFISEPKPLLLVLSLSQTEEFQLWSLPEGVQGQLCSQGACEESALPCHGGGGRDCMRVVVLRHAASHQVWLAAAHEGMFLAVSGPCLWRHQTHQAQSVHKSLAPNASALPHYDFFLVIGCWAQQIFIFPSSNKRFLDRMVSFPQENKM